MKVSDITDGDIVLIRNALVKGVTPLAIASGYRAVYSDITEDFIKSLVETPKKAARITVNTLLR